MKRKISLIVAIVGLISLIAGGSLLFKSLTASRDEYESLKTSIINDYENFKVKIESFSEERTNVYEGLNEITYLTDMIANYDLLVAEYDKYGEALKEIEESSKGLKVNCYKKNFVETEINNKVSAFTINYEQAINYYIQDVEKFNEKVRAYNTWVNTNNLQATHKIYDEYESLYKDYVDVNGDGIFNGVNNK